MNQEKLDALLDMFIDLEETGNLNYDEASIQMAQYHDKNLRKKTVFRDEEIREFDPEVILGTNNENKAKKAALQIKTEFNQKQTSDEQLNQIKCTFKNLEESELTITPSCVDYHRLIEINECLAEKLKILQRNEQRHNADIEKLKMSKNNLEIELCNVNNQLREKGYEVEKLTEQLKGSRRVRNEPQEGHTALDWLEDWCRDLKTDVATAEAKLSEYRASRCQGTDSEHARPREAEARVGVPRRESDVAEDVAALRTRAEAAEGLLEITKRSTAARNRARDEVCDRLRRKNAELAGENAELTREKAELGGRVRRLRDGTRRRGRPKDSGRSGVVGGASTCSRPVDGGGSAPLDGFFDRLKRMFRGPGRAPDELRRESK